VRGISYIGYNKERANWTGHILYRKCLLKQIIECGIDGKMEVTGR
jgi:hypothetical protein